MLLPFYVHASLGFAAFGFSSVFPILRYICIYYFFRWLRRLFLFIVAWHFLHWPFAFAYSGWRLTRPLLILSGRLLLAFLRLSFTFIHGQIFVPSPVCGFKNCWLCWPLNSSKRKRCLTFFFYFLLPSRLKSPRQAVEDILEPFPRDSCVNPPIEPS